MDGRDALVLQELITRHGPEIGPAKKDGSYSSPLSKAVELLGTLPFLAKCIGEAVFDAYNGPSPGRQQ